MEGRTGIAKGKYQEVNQFTSLEVFAGCENVIRNNNLATLKYKFRK
jgi:hypothetical protein